MKQGKGGKTQKKLVEEVADLIVGAKRVVVFTGAGISTESGIPDFRGPDGLWTKVDPEDFTYRRFVTSSEARKRLWGLGKTMGSLWHDMKPNKAHYAVVEMEKLGKLDCVITQNVDGLHQKAGNSENKVIQLHGNMQRVKCLFCGEHYSLEQILRWVEAGAEDPKCARCGGILKPEGVFFGEAMPVKEVKEAKRRSQSCDLCIVVGSTLEVYPAAEMPQYAVKSGAKLVIINEGQTSLDHAADIRIDDKAGKVMLQVVKRVKKKLGSRTTVVKKIILASASPRRKELLEKIGLKFEVEPSDYTEDMRSGLNPRKLAESISLGKAKAVSGKHKNAIVIAADTFIVFGDKIMGKPNTEAEAEKMLMRLRGKSHSVITGFTILDADNDKVLTKSVETVVHIKNLTPEEIDAYIKSGEPLDKAGAYAIQGLGSVIVEKIEGDYFNVMGLPLSALTEGLKGFGIHIL